MDPRSPTPERPDHGRASARFVVALALVMMTGPVLPLSWGFALPLLILVGCTWLVAWRRAAEREAGHATGTATPMSVVALACLSTAVFLTVAARAIAAIVMVYPAALWAALACVVAAPVLGSLRALDARVRGVVGIVLVTAAALGGAAFEASGSHARGWAHSAPVHGIHPFQMTAVVIDGHGPFDVPINDYVEPDGSRGYGPEALADALERALHRIASVHFEPSSRAFQAFAQARVEAFEAPAVRERLSEEPLQDTHPRFIVWSGTTGPRSRVEFVCPGRREDPRPFPGEALEQRMCPSKYASEASAGLGVTGRWPGYAEGRGTARWSWLSLPPEDTALASKLAFGGVIVLVGVLVLVGGLALRPSVAHGASLVAAGSGGALALAWVVVLLATVSFGMGQRAWWVEPFTVPSAPSAEVGATWWTLAALASGAWASWRRHDGGPKRRIDGSIAAVAGIIGLFTVWTCGHLDALAWARPVLSLTGSELPFEAFVRGIAQASVWAIDVQRLEAVVAGWMTALLIGFMVAALRGLAQLAVPRAQARPPRARMASATLWLPFAVVLVACGLGFSRATDGAAALFPGALALTLPIHTRLLLDARRHEVDARTPRILLVVHALAVALACVGLLASAELVDARHPFSWLCLGLAALVVLWSAWPKPRHDA